MYMPGVPEAQERCENNIKSLQPIINNVSLFNNENLLRRKTDKTDIFVSVCEVFSFEFIDTRMLFM